MSAFQFDWNPLVEWLKNQSDVGMSYVHLWNNWHMTSKGACGGTIVWTSTLTTWMGMDINLKGYHREHELWARNTNVSLLQRFGRLLETLHKFCTSHELMNVGGVFLRNITLPKFLCSHGFKEQRSVTQESMNNKLHIVKPIWVLIEILPMGTTTSNVFFCSFKFCTNEFNLIGSFILNDDLNKVTLS